MRSRLLLVALLAAAVALTAGCGVKKSIFGESMGEVNSRVDGIQSTVERQGEQIDTVRAKGEELERGLTGVRSEMGSIRETSEMAMETAKSAQAAAGGKVLWQVTLTNRDVNFKVDGWEVTPDAASKLQTLISTLRSYDKMVFIEVQGHTDSTGSDSYNHELGLKRAESVRNYLHEQGIPLNLIEVISYGESRPVADNSSRDGRAANRRVEVLVLE